MRRWAPRRPDQKGKSCGMTIGITCSVLPFTACFIPLPEKEMAYLPILGHAGWQHIQNLENKAFICGFCNTKVASDRGYIFKLHQPGVSHPMQGGVYICSNCGNPIFHAPNRRQYPSPPFGNPVPHVPKELNDLYEEARRCTGENCFTAAVLLCRKMLMNIAVQEGAKEGLKFIEYVNHLSDKGYIPPNGKHWVDHIRTKGNEATHEIALMNQEDARDLLSFVEMILRFIYEFPQRVPQPQPV